MGVCQVSSVACELRGPCAHVCIKPYHHTVPHTCHGDRSMCEFRTGLCASHLGSSPPRHVWPCDGYIPCRCRLQPSSRGPLGAVLGSRLWLMRTSHFECSRLDAHPSATVVVDRVDRAGDRRRRRPLDGRLLGWAAQRLPTSLLPASPQRTPACS